MPLAAYYVEIRWLHIGAVIASGSLFTIRGLMMLARSRLTNHVGLRTLSIVIDTTLLAAAVVLTMIIHQYPFVQAWLTAKVLLLVVYILLGTLALKRGRTYSTRATCYVLAITVYLFIVTVARAHNPLGIFASFG